MANGGADLFEELMRFKPEGLTPNGWAVQAGVGRTIWADLRRHGNPSRRTLSKLLEAAGSSLAEFEALRAGRAAVPAGPADALAEASRAWRQAPLPPLPLLMTEQGGFCDAWGTTVDLLLIERGSVVDRLPRPPSLAGDRAAYAISVVGGSMWPRFRQGRHVAVSPSASFAAGDDVLLILAGGNRAVIGELRSSGGGRTALRQFNPPVEFSMSADNVDAIHKIIGELI